MKNLNIYLTYKIKTIPKINRLDKIIQQKIKFLSRNKIQNLIKQQQILINNNISIKKNKKLKINDIITIIKPITTYINTNNKKKKIPINIIYEDTYLLIINKQNGLIVHPGIGTTNNTLLNALMYYYPKNFHIPRYGIIHRLDKNTTGLMIIAKKINIYYILNKEIKNKNITRIYTALVYGKIKKNNIINLPISRHKKIRTKMSVNPKGKPSITYYYVLEKFKKYTLLNIKLHTGRTHQIRVHMQYIQHPVVGDQTYYNKYYINDNYHITKYSLNRQFLHAKKLQFIHPIYKTVILINIPLPLDLNNMLCYLRTSNLF